MGTTDLDFARHPTPIWVTWFQTSSKQTRLHSAQKHMV